MTLFLYKLLLNLEDRAVRRDLSNAYDMHRTLTRAFVDGDLGKPQPFLWRLETSAADEVPFVLVQSSMEARWGVLPKGYLLSQQERIWSPETVLTPGRRVAFRVRANPTVNRVPQAEVAKGGEGQSARGHRKRLGIWRESEQLEWMKRQAIRLGLDAVEASVSQAERLRCRKRDAKASFTMTLASAQFDGTAVIADPGALIAGLRSGIGHGRMLGHGLVSLAPLRE
jgi:CRISPR system Cascade subunit CasE